MDHTTLCGFTGTYRDPVTAGYPLGDGYRWYLPTWMRFTAPDHSSPFNGGGVNPYVYCGADPINRTDPTGHAWEDVGEELGSLVRGMENTHLDSPLGVVHETAQKALTPTQKKAGMTILRRWRKFATKRRQVVGDLSALLPSMGERMTDAEEFPRIMKEGRIIVQVNGSVEDPLTKHSALYFERKEYGLNIVDGAKATEPLTSKYGLSSQMTDFLNDKFGAVAFRPEDRSVILAEEAKSTTDKIIHLTQKGRMFVLHPKYSAHFQTALDAEDDYLTDAPNSYGLHYNCHTFVFNMLRRLQDLG